MSYFPSDIPYMSKKELLENGIKIPKIERVLKPCPFCGGKARLWKIAFFSCEVKVMCPTCRIQTATYKEPNMDNAVWFAVNAWNRRVTK